MTGISLALATLALGAALASSPANAQIPEPAGDCVPDPARAPRADQPVGFITGSTSGLGRATAVALGQRGWHVAVHGRDAARGAEVASDITEAGGSATFFAADLGSISETARLAEAVACHLPRLDVLVNNAGIWLTGDDRRRVSADGIELSFHVNYLAGYQLTEALLPLLTRSSPSRIVNVASIAQTPIDFADPLLERGYSGGRAYGQSKLAQIIFTFDLAERLEGTGVSVNALHPSTLMATDMVRDAGMQPRTTVEEGRDALLRLILDPDAGSGRYFDVTTPTRAHAQAYDAGARQRLRELSTSLLTPPAW